MADQRPIVPDHELLRKIGHGSYGEVWLARNVMGSFRAVKVVYRASFDSKKPYEREFGGLQKFEPVSRTHPGLVSILHMGQTEAYFYCVMEVADDATEIPNSGSRNPKQSRTTIREPSTADFPPGASGSNEPSTFGIRHSELYIPRTLAHELSKRGRLPFEECIELGVALSEALAHLHAHGLVHRDIKPANIIFVGGIPKLADIGLVTHIGSKATFVGTEGYIPPEGPGSPGADIYSLGKLLYEISTGKTQEQFPELPTLLRELPEAPQLMGLNSVVLKACEPHSAKRFQSAEALRAALVQFRPKISRPWQDNSVTKGSREAAIENVVILCPTTSALELSVARSLSDRLAREGFRVFWEEQPVLSVEWARRLEQQIRTAHVVIPVLSESSVRSELMAYTLEIGHQSAQRPSNLPQFVPVLVEFEVPLRGHAMIALEGSSPVSTDGTHPDELIQHVLAAIQSVREPVAGKK